MNFLFENIAAIDIGSSGIRMIKIRTGFKNFQVQSLSYENYDPAISEHKDAVLAALEKILLDDRVDKYTVISNISMEQVIIRNITFPFKDRQKIADAIPFEAEENVPLSLNELAVDFKYIGTDEQDKGSILLAAVTKDAMRDYLEIFQSAEINVSTLGLEADSLLACYNHFYTVKDETALQVHIGSTKTIVNIISDGALLYTRSCPIGTNQMEKEAASYLKIEKHEAAELLQSLSNIDITSLDHNIEQETNLFPKLTKTQAKKIFSYITNFFESLLAQIQMTIEAYGTETSLGNIHRIILSGGGANIQGAAAFLTKNMNIPAVPLPFLSGYNDHKINSIFTMALGLVLSRIDRNNNSINFLQGDLSVGAAAKGRKIYYLAGFFFAMAFMILLLNIIISFIFNSNSNLRYDKILRENYRKYFAATEIPDDVIQAATERLNKEKKEFNSLYAVVGDEASSLELMHEILSYFESNSAFELKNFTLNENTIRITGATGSSADVDRFKEKLQQSGLFDSVSINISSSRSGLANFTLNIKKTKENSAQ